MFDTIIGLATSSGLGAVIGALGNWINKREERKNKELSFTHELAMAQLAVSERELEQSHEILMADKQMERAQTEGDIQVELSELGAFTASVKDATKATGVKFVDAVRGLMRPVITAYLLGIATYIVVKISALVGGLKIIPLPELVTMYTGIITQIIFLTTVAVTWWFASRPSRSTS